MFDATPGTSDLAFWIITFALSTSEKRIHNFETWSGVSTATFDTQSKATERMLLHGVKAFAWLKKLRLNILSGENDTRNPDEYGDARYPDEYRNLSGLPILLDRMRDLEVLELYIPHDYMDASHPQGIYFKYESIFPKDGAWPHLRTFSLREIEIRDRDLVHLVFARMPSLQHLQIEDVELLDGNWESVIEALKFRRLSSLDMRSSRNLLYDDGKNFLSWLRDHVDGDAGKDFFDNLERYVVHGLQDVTLRHPSLEHNQPTQDSLDYLCGIFDQANGIRCIEDIDFAELKKNVAKACAEENRERQMA